MIHYSLQGKCKHCGKAFPSKLGFGSPKEIVGLSCTWCKYSYHNRDNCLQAMNGDVACDLGQFAAAVLPPSWIVKRPRRGSFKSSLKSSPNKAARRRRQLMAKRESEDATATASAREAREAREEEELTPKSAFCIKPIPSNAVAPVLVFLNPKSGGNQGAKLMQKFQWLLNPRQVGLISTY